MAIPALQSFVDNVGPRLLSSWLNSVDRILNRYRRTPAEIAAGVLVVNDEYDERHIYRYGDNDEPGTTDMTSAIHAAASVAEQYGGAQIFLPAATIAYDGDLLDAYTEVVVEGVGRGTILKALSSSGRILLDNGTWLRNLVVDPGTVRASSIGVQFGRSTGFKARGSIENVVIKNFEQGILLENCYFVDMLGRNYIQGGTRGIVINPTNGGGGYLTTINIDIMRITDCEYEGIKDYKTSSNKYVINAKRLVVENCCNNLASEAMIDLGPQIACELENVYGESSAATKPTFLRARNGLIKTLYINGANLGVDGGATSCRLEICNGQIISTGASVSTTAGANAHVIMRRMHFSTANTITADTIVYDHCDGTLPTGISANSYAIAGSNPRFAVGSFGSSNIKEIICGNFTENTTALANAATGGATVSVGTGKLADGAVVAVFPRTALPVGINYSAMYVTDNGFAMRYSNPTGSNQSITDTFDYVIFRRE